MLALDRAVTRHLKAQWRLGDGCIRFLGGDVARLFRGLHTAFPFAKTSVRMQPASSKLQLQARSIPSVEGQKRAGLA